MVCRLFAVIIAVCASPIAASAQSMWHLTTADFQSSTLDLQKIDATAIHGVSPSAQDVSVPLDQFLDVSRILPHRNDAATHVLFFQGGDRLGGEPTGMSGERLLWHSSTLGDLKIPLRDLVAIGAAGAFPPDQRPSDDVATLGNNDVVHGILTAIDGGKVTIQTSGGNDAALPLASMKLIAFAASAGRHLPRKSFRVSFDDDSQITTDSVALDGNVLRFTIAGNPASSIDGARVVAIEQVNGPVSWLSVRPPSENIFTPFIAPGQAWPAQMNRSVTGEPIRFRDTTFTHGIGVHAYSRLSWPLDAGWAAFRTQFAIDGDDSDALAADVTIRIRLDGKVVYEQPHVHGGELSPIILQQLEGAKSLTLEADFGDRLDTRARLNWIEPALLKNPPTPMVVSPTPATAPSTAPSTGK
jgi:hypothetical protein